MLRTTIVRYQQFMNDPINRREFIDLIKRCRLTLTWHQRVEFYLSAIEFSATDLPLTIESYYQWLYNLPEAKYRQLKAFLDLTEW